MNSNKSTHFDENTPEEVKKILESELHSNNRIRLFFGDKKTGRDWNEEWDTMGYIGRSGGDKPILILLNNRRFMGGGAILTACIVKITRNGHILYKHPNYHTHAHVVGNPVNDGYQDAAYVEKDDKLELVAQFKKKGRAQKWIDFIKGRKDNKS